MVRLTYDVIAHDRASRVLKGVGDEADRTKTHLSGMGTALGAGAGLLAAGGLALVTSGLVDTAVSAEALHNKAKVVFGPEFAKASETAGRLAGDLGQTRTQTEGLLAGFGDLLTPMGFGTAKAADMSSQLGTLTAALTQWSGGTKNASEISDVLQAALTGEYDSLKGLGVQIDAELVKQKLHEKGMDKLTGSARKQAEAGIVLEEIHKQSSNAITGYEKKTNKLGLAKQNLTSDIETLKEELAQGLTPALAAVGDWLVKTGIPALKSFGGWVQDNSDWLVPLAAAIGAVVVAIGTWMAVSKTFILVQTAVNLVLAANPIGLIVLALIGLGVGLVVAYKKSETFRDIVNGAFKAVVNGVLDMAGKILDASVWAFGWIPGIGDKLRRAQEKFRAFQVDVNESLSGIHDRTVFVTVKGLQGGKKVNLKVDALSANVREGRGRAFGGPVSAGQAYTVGETGREIFIPDRSGMILPNRALGGAGVVVNVTQPLGTPEQIGAAVAGALASYARSRGGVSTRSLGLVQ